MPTKRQAEILDAKVKEAKAIGDLDFLRQLTRERMPLHEFVTEHWDAKYARTKLTPRTRHVARSNWNARIRPAIGSVMLHELSGEHVDELLAAMAKDDLAPMYQRRVINTLSTILGAAVTWGFIRDNPVKGMKLPPKRRARRIYPLPPTRVEAIRAELDQRGGLLVSLVAYELIRPGEALGLRWGDVGERTISVPAEVAKTGNARQVPLWGTVAAELRAWRLASGRPAPEAWLLPNAHGAQTSAASYAQWRYRTFTPAAQRAGETIPPYDLRHSGVSLLIQAGFQILEVARIAGHSPEVTLRTYGHLFAEYDPSDRIDVERAIEAARGATCEPSVSSAQG